MKLLPQLLVAVAAVALLAATQVTVSAADLQDLRTAKAVWVPIESGVPGIYFARNTTKCDDDRDALIATFLDRATLKLGPYDVQIWDPIANKTHVEHVVVTAEHLKLLRNAVWECSMEDPKRPYGDMTYFEIDMARILGIPLAAGGRPRPQDERRLDQLHRETLPALQAFLLYARIES